MEYYSAIKKEKFTLYNSVDEFEKHDARLNKPVREKQSPYDFAHIWNLMNKLN